MRTAIKKKNKTKQSKTKRHTQRNEENKTKIGKAVRALSKRLRNDNF